MTDLTKEEKDLVDAITTFSDTVKDLKRKRFRFNVIVSIGFGIVLAAIMAIVLILSLSVLPQIDKNAKRATASAEKANSVEAKIAESELTRCKSGNDFRENDRARWQFIINLSPMPTTPEEKTRLDTFKKYINEADALKDCSKLETTTITIPTPATSTTVGNKG